jgi:DNA polymerase-1
LVADYSQIELRITAHKSGDPTLLRYFKEGKDPHARTAYKLFPHIQRDVDAKFGGIDSKEAQKYVKTTYEEERGRGKTFNFMALYGGGTKRAMGVFGVGKEEAEEKIAQFWDAYPTVRRMLDRSTQKARKLGYVENLFGMRFHLPDINHHDIWIRRSVERQAGNYEIQGSAGGIIKMAMILIHRDERLKAVGYKQILQIHDELVGYSPLGAREVVEPIVKDLMENSYLHFGFKPLGSQEFGRLETTVEPGFGAHWAEAKH